MGQTIIDSGGNVALILDTAGGVVHEVNRDQSWRLASLLCDPIRPLEGLLSGKDMVAIDGHKKVVKGDGTGIGIGIDRRGDNAVRRTWLGGRQGEGVDEVPVILLALTLAIMCMNQDSSYHPQ